MPEEQAATGPFKHPPRPRRDGFFETIHPTSGDRLYLLRIDLGQHRASSAAWESAFALQKKLAETNPSAWWPVSEFGVDGDVVFAAFPVWKTTLAEDLNKAYRCRSEEAKALASAMVDALGQLEAAAQRPLASFKYEAVVFPQGAGGAHDSLSPRLNRLVPLEETDPRHQQADRRNLGCLLYGAIVGTDASFDGGLDFESTWTSVEIPNRAGWRKLIEELNSGALEAEPWDKLRRRIETLGGGRKKTPLALGAAVLAAAAVAGYFLLNRSAGPDAGPKSETPVVVVPPTNPPAVAPTNPPAPPPKTDVAEAKPAPPAVDTNQAKPQKQIPREPEIVRSDMDLAMDALNDSGGALFKRISPEPVSSRRMKDVINQWWKRTPEAPEGLWMRVTYRAGAPAELAWNRDIVTTLGAEADRRDAFASLCAQLAAAQRKATDVLHSQITALGWGDAGVDGAIEAGALGAIQGKLREADNLVFSDPASGVRRFDEAWATALAAAPQPTPSLFPAWSRFTPQEKADSGAYLRDVWKTNVSAWASAPTPTPANPAEDIAALRAYAADNKLPAPEAELDALNSAYLELSRKARLHGFSDEAQASKAASAIRTGLADLRTRMDRQLSAEKQRQIAAVKEQDQQWTAAADAKKAGGDILGARKDLLAHLEGKARDRYPLADEFLRNSEDPALAQEFAGLAATDPAAAQQGLREKLGGKSRERFPQAYARLDGLSDLVWAKAAQDRAKASVAGGLAELDKDLGGDGAPDAPNSKQLQKELRSVQQWLKSDAFSFGDAGWRPGTPPPVETGWESRFQEVQVQLSTYQTRVAEWAKAEEAAKKVDAISAKEDLGSIKAALQLEWLKNKEPFAAANQKVGALDSLIRTIDAARASKQASDLKSAMAQAGASKGVPYIGSLLPVLQAEADQADKAEQALAAAKAAAEEKIRESKPYKDAIADMAKKVGGVTVFGKEYAKVADIPDKTAENLRKALLDLKKKYLDRNPEETEKTTGISKLQERLEAIMANGN